MLRGLALEVYRSGRPGATPGELYASLLSDQFFRVPSIRLAEAHVEAGGATWMYEFAWPSPQFGGRLGACHALESGFVFDNLGKGRARLHGEDPLRDLAAAMHGSWLRFATTCDPGWPPYELPRRSTMMFWPTCETVNDPRAAERIMWAGVPK
jgi:para-nitrobenzyl esterase